MKDRSGPSAASTGMDLGWAVTSTMLSGLFLFGGAGWLLDRWWGTRFVVAIGAVVGLALGVYAIVMRYGHEPTAPNEMSSGQVSGTASTDGPARNSTSPRGNAQ